MAVVSVDDVSKRYVLRHERQRSFQQMAIDFFTRRGQVVEEFWALHNVSFQVEAGETFGIVGANGSGKSTLLKLIARVIAPTSGSIQARGRVAALIELGAGFHPELTGRENVYLHGSFLGFTRRQMHDRYERIVEFAELDNFMDTPLKHFSSGMMMRLGFATSMAVDADLMIIDEVLAVGDVRFQQKCLDALRTFKESGGTLLVVAQDPNTVRRLCDRALLLSHGRAVACGPASSVVSEYAHGTTSGQEQSSNFDGAIDRSSAPAFLDQTGKDAEILSVQTLDGTGKPTDTFLSGDEVIIEIAYELRRAYQKIVPGLQFLGENGEYLYGSGAEGFEPPNVPGTYRVQVSIAHGPFVGGTYRYCAGLTNIRPDGDWESIAYRDKRDVFHILPVTFEEGLIRIATHWTVVEPETGRVGERAKDPISP